MTRLDTVYPSQFPDPREAPPPWVKQQNERNSRRKRNRIVPIAAAAVLLLTASFGAVWFYARSDGLNVGNSFAGNIGTWVNQASNAAASGVRGTGRALKSLLPVGQDNPSVQSIVLLPQSQQPSVQIPTPAADGETVAQDNGAPLDANTASVDGASGGNDEAFELTITPTSSDPPVQTTAPDPLKTVESPQSSAPSIVEVVKLPEQTPLPEAGPPGEESVSAPPSAASPASTDRNFVLLPPSAPTTRPAEQAPAAPEPPAPQAAAAEQVAELPPAPQPEPTPVGDTPPVDDTPAVVVAVTPPPSQALPEPPRDVWRVQLASVGDGTAAQAEWRRLQEIHSALLAGQQVHIEQVELDRGTFFRIQAGAFDAVAGAEQLCAGLKARGQDCLVVR